MNSLCLKNGGMGEDSFAVLARSVRRYLTLREVLLTDGEEAFVLTVRQNAAYTNDRYRISVSGRGADICASNDCAIHAAVGRFLLETVFDGRGSMLPPKKGTVLDFTPERPIRGMYLATHFYNFYHSAPIGQVYEVLEDLALRGCNSILVWFDMHHFPSMQDPAARELADRLREILGYANRIGMSGSLTMLSNEAFSSSPQELRAEWHAVGGYHTKPDDHYHLEICPSKPGGTEEILRERREMLSYFSDLDIRYICYWPYDQGGCTCEKCQPWGSNGFLRLLPHFQALVRELLPKTEIIVSTWYFDKFIDGEWDAFYPQMSGPVFRDIRYVMAFFFHGRLPRCIAEHGIPDGVRFVDFPEISMYSCNPWGGYGASVLTEFLDETNKASGSLYSGGFPYSEGIFEDANKFIQLSFYSGLYPDAHDALRAYVRSEFCCTDDELYEAVRRTETALARGKDRTQAEFRCEIQCTDDVEFVYRTLTRYRELLPPRIAQSVKFRLFYLRAVIDYELTQHGGYPIRSPRCQEAMREINSIYCADERTKRWVKAPAGI